jgi:hypothetical protein
MHGDDVSDVGLEVPEADRLEQLEPVDPDDFPAEDPIVLTYDADPADVLEQSIEVPNVQEEDE